MQKLKIKLPTLESRDSNALDPRPKVLKAWLDDLPLGDMEASGLQILTVLKAYNRTALSPSVRLEALNIFGRVVQELTAGLAAKFRDRPFR